MVKINISPEEISGYISTGYTLNIDEYCANGEADEIICNIDFLPAEKFIGFLHHLKDKVSIKGKLIINGTDLIEVCHSILREKIPQDQANMFIYGESSKPPKKMMISLNTLVDNIENLGMKVLKKRIDGLIMCVEAVRNH